ncbi:hypothetical protein EMCRGX_G030634 [Ephydatia muelleri]|eukprot:Em0010g878a
MEAYIQAELSGAEPGEVEELNLDNVKSSKLAGLTDKFASLKHLSLINVGLITLEGFPALPKLETLDLGDNKLTNGLEMLANCPSLRVLNLVGNRISTLEDLKPLCKLPQLSSLDLYNCPVTRSKDYRDKVFDLLPALQSLDGLNSKGEEVEDSEDDDQDREGNREDGDEAENSGDEEPGLEYLQKELGPESSGESDEYNPAEDDVSAEEDHTIESGEDEDEEEGRTSIKRPRLDPEPQQQSSDSDA